MTVASLGSTNWSRRSVVLTCGSFLLMGDNGSVHELGLLSGVVDVVVQAADQRTIRRVALRVGARSGVVPEALHAAWPIASLSTVCADAELTVEHIEATVWCPTCAAEQPIDEFLH